MCCCEGGRNVTLQLLLRVASQCWMVPGLICLLLATGFNLAAAITQNWVRIECDEDVVVEFGLSELCYKNKTISDHMEYSCATAVDHNGMYRYTCRLIKVHVTQQ